jgi:hypothetical protein
MEQEETVALRGRVVDAATGRALCGLHIRAYDRNLVWDDCLGCDDTDEHGDFRIPLRDGEEADVHIVVYGPEPHQVHFSRPVRPMTAAARAEIRIALQTGRTLRRDRGSHPDVRRAFAG